MRHMTGDDGLAIPAATPNEQSGAAGIGYHAGSAKDYDRAHAIDVSQLFAFLRTAGWPEMT